MFNGNSELWNTGEGFCALVAGQWHGKGQLLFRVEDRSGRSCTWAVGSPSYWRWWQWSCVTAARLRDAMAHVRVEILYELIWITWLQIFEKWEQHMQPNGCPDPGAGSRRQANEGRKLLGKNEALLICSINRWQFLLFCHIFSKGRTKQFHTHSHSSVWKLCRGKPSAIRSSLVQVLSKQVWLQLHWPALQGGQCLQYRLGMLVLVCWALSAHICETRLENDTDSSQRSESRNMCWNMSTGFFFLTKLSGRR